MNLSHFRRSERVSAIKKQKYPENLWYVMGVFVWVYFSHFSQVEPAVVVKKRFFFFGNISTHLTPIHVLHSFKTFIHNTFHLCTYLLSLRVELSCDVMKSSIHIFSLSLSLSFWIFKKRWSYMYGCMYGAEKPWRALISYISFGVWCMIWWYS